MEFDVVYRGSSRGLLRGCRGACRAALVALAVACRGSYREVEPWHAIADAVGCHGLPWQARGMPWALLWQRNGMPPKS